MKVWSTARGEARWLLSPGANDHYTGGPARLCVGRHGCIASLHPGCVQGLIGTLCRVVPGRCGHVLEVAAQCFERILFRINLFSRAVTQPAQYRNRRTPTLYCVLQQKREKNSRNN